MSPGFQTALVDSPLVLPLAVGFLLIGCFSAMVWRSPNAPASAESWGGAADSDYKDYNVASSPSSRTTPISRRRNHRKLQSPSPSRPDSRRFRRADATHTVLRTAARLSVPTIAFVITVFGEVSADRLLDAILP